MSNPNEIEIRKSLYLDARIGQVISHAGKQYTVIGEGGFRHWAYWILRAVAVPEQSQGENDRDDSVTSAGLAAVPLSFMQGLAESDQGRVVDLDIALSQPPPQDSPDPTPVSEPDPTPEPTPELESPDPAYDQTPDYTPAPDPDPNIDTSGLV